MYIKLPGLVVVGALLSACNGGPKAIEGEDWSVTTPELELIYPLREKRARETYTEISITAVYGEAGFSMAIPAGDSAVIDDQSIDGPTTLQVAHTLGIVSAKYVHYTPVSRCLNLVWGAGGGYLESNLTGRTDTQRYSRTRKAALPVGMIGITCQVTPKLNLLASRSMSFMFLHPWFIEDRLQIQYKMSPSIQLNAGYKYWGYFDTQDNDSDVKVSYYGPTLGMSWYF